MPGTPEKQKLVRISDFCHYIPASDNYGAVNDPELVLIFGWANAKLSHVLRYAAQYARIYPAASQLLIECEMKAMMLGSTRESLRRQRPILDKLFELGLFTAHPPRMLFHVFSSGGVSQLLWLARAISQAETDRTSPLLTRPCILVPTCIILDSAPTALRLDDIQRGFEGIYTNAPSRILVITAATLFYTASNLLALLRIRPALRLFVRSGLIDPHLLPWTDAATPRLYIYSDADEVAGAGDVEAHMMEARRRGMDVRAEVFIGSGHVGHARQDPKRYWGAVAEAWRDAVRVRAKL